MAETSRKDPINTNKTRKSRNEMVRTALGLYLKQKNYVAIDKFRKSDFVLSQTTKQFIFNKMIDEDISRVNSFLYSNVLCLSNNHVTVEHQFNKFVQFVQSQNEPIKSELTNLFGPIICHLYIELLKGREWKPACDFLRNHAHLVAPVENLNAPLPNKVNGCSVNSGYHDESFPAVTSQILFTNESTQNPTQDQFKEIIQNLSTCLRVEAFENIESIVLFRSSKYVIEISLPAVNVLKNFLDKHGHIIILNILHVWIHFEIKDLKDENEDSMFVLEEEIDKPILENGIDHHKLEVKKEKESPKTKIEPKVEDDAKSSPEKTSKKTANTYLRRLKHASTKLQKLDTPTRSFNLSDPEKMLASATMDADECHIAAGFDNSIIKIFQLNKATFRGRNMFDTFKNKVCSWNVNCMENEEFDSSSEEEEKLSVDTETFNSIPNKKARRERFKNEKYEGNSFNDSGGICLRGHSKGVTDVIFSSHYPVLLSTSKDQTIRAWTASNYTCGGVYRGHNYPIWCINESPVGMYFATGSKDLTARLWTTDREFPLTTYVGHTQDIDCIAFHPNGNYLATGSSDLTVRLWSVTSGKLFRVFTECKFPVTCIQFSPDGKLLAAAGEEAKVRIFDLAAGSQISELKDHSAPVTSIAWNRSGSKCASVCSDGSVRMWDVAKIGVGDSQSSSSTITCNKLLWHMAGCNRAVRILFNSTDTISCIGSSQ